MTESTNLITYSLFFIGTLITLILPLPLKEEYRLSIITIIVFIFLITTLSKFNEKIIEKDNKIEEINKRFKTIEELNDIRLDNREIKKRVFK